MPAMDEEQPQQPAGFGDESQDKNDAQLSPHTHAFIVKIWLEEQGTEARPPLWRGHITHVKTHKQRYFQDPAIVLQFIQTFLKE
jgi:hypothetical protein